MSIDIGKQSKKQQPIPVISGDGNIKNSLALSFETTLFSIDAKLLQYYYLNEKLLSFIHITKKLKESMKDSQLSNIGVVDPQSVVLLSGSIFNINDNFYRRSELLQNCQKYNPAQKINVPFTLSPVSFDSLENISRNSPVGPYGTPLNKMVPLPNKKIILESIILLELLLLSVYEVVNVRFKTSLSEFNRQHGIEETKNSLNSKLNKLQFEELLIAENLKFSSIPEIPINKQELILKFYLKNQFNFLEGKIAIFQNIIDKLKSEIHKNISSISKSKNSSRNQSTLLYNMYILLLRIADIYIEIRKSGKTIYCQNINYFSPYSKQCKNIREILNKMSIYFINSKQNSMILTLISKYAKRTEIKNINMDFNIFVSEFRKTSLDMVSLLDNMVSSLKGLHNEWTMIVSEGKDNEFSKEYLREKLRERVNLDREKRKSIMIENQKELKLQMEHQLAGSVTPSNIHNNSQKFNVHRISSMDSIKEKIDGDNDDINKNELIDEDGKKATTLQTKSSLSSIQRRIATNNTSNANNPAVNVKVHRMSISGVPNNNIEPTKTKTSVSSTRKSLTSSARSPFYNNINNDSRSNSLTRTDAARQSVTKKTSLGDFKADIKSNKLSDISESDSFIEPPKIGGNYLESKSSNDLSSSSPSRSPSLSRNSPINRNRTNSLTSSPNSVKNGDIIKRRSSVIIPRSPSQSQLQQSQLTAAARGANLASVRRRQSIIGQPSPTNSDKEAHIKAAALAAKQNISPNLTAQQRLQQHILKSARNGSVYSKPLENRRVSMILPTNNDNNNENDDVRIENLIDPNIEIEIISTSPNKSEMIEGVSNELNSLISEDSNTFNNEETLTEFPSSPLNSLKTTSLEAQNALKLQRINRSRSNSNQNLIMNSNSNTPLSKPARLSPTKPSSSPSPTKIRSRSNSALNKMLPVSKQVSIDSNSNGSITDLSRSSSVSSSISTRTRSNSALGNTVVVSGNETIPVNSNGEFIKRVRFTGVSQYSEDEDAPTPQRMQKQIRQKWAAYKPLFRKLNSQEGLVFKQNLHDDEANNKKNNNNTSLVNNKGVNSGLITGSMNLNSGGLALNPNLINSQAQVENNGKVLLMDLITSNAQNEGAKVLSNKTLRRDTSSATTTLNNNGVNTTNRLSRLFRKR